MVIILHDIKRQKSHILLTSGSHAQILMATSKVKTARHQHFQGHTLRRSDIMINTAILPLFYFEVQVVLFYQKYCPAYQAHFISTKYIL